MKRLRGIILTLGGILSFTQAAWADGGMGFLIFVPLPLLSVFTVRLTYGFSLVLIIAIEALVLKLRGRFGWKKSIILSFVANIFSTLIGMGIFGVCETFSLIYITAALFAGALLFAYMFNTIFRRTGYYSTLIANRFPNWVFYVACFLAFPLLCIAAWLVGKAPATLTFRPSSLAALGGLLIIGFILTIISEGFIVIRFVPKNYPKIVSTVVLMNALSYIVLIALVLLLTYMGNPLSVW
jgi:hypothetical protein